MEMKGDFCIRIFDEFSELSEFSEALDKQLGICEDTKVEAVFPQQFYGNRKERRMQASLQRRNKKVSK